MESLARAGDVPLQTLAGFLEMGGAAGWGRSSSFASTLVPSSFSFCRCLFHLADISFRRLGMAPLLGRPPAGGEHDFKDHQRQSLEIVRMVSCLASKLCR